MHDVFISYSFQNKETADAICHHLEASGVRCWYAPRDIKPGDPWAASIVQAIKASKVFVLIFSKESNTSKQVLREITLASEAECVIIPFKIDNTVMNDDFMYYLKSVHWFDAINPPLIKNLDNLRQKINAILGITPPPPPPKKTRWKRMTMYIVAALVVLVAIFGIKSYITSMSARTEVKSIDFKYMSEFEKYRYPFFSTGGFIADGNWIFYEKKEDSTLTLAKAEAGHPLNNEIVYPYAKDSLSHNIDHYYSNVSATAAENSDVIYFIDSMDGTVKIYDRAEEKWINANGVKMNLKETEFASLTITADSGLYQSQSDLDCLTILVYDSAAEAEYFSKVLRVDPSENECQVCDISQYEIAEILFTFESKNSGLPADSIIVYGKENIIYLLNIKTGETKKLSHKELFETYLPHTTDTSLNVKIRSDGKYIAKTQNNGSEWEILVWNAETGKTIFSGLYKKGFEMGFLPDGKFYVFNEENYTLKSYDLDNNNHSTVILDKKSFTENEHYFALPYGVEYSKELEMFFFFCSVEGAADEPWIDQLVACDLSGKVIAKSQKVEIPYESYAADIYVNDDKLFYVLWATDPEEVESTIITKIYRCLYSYDENGNVIFTQD